MCLITCRKVFLNSVNVCMMHTSHVHTVLSEIRKNIILYKEADHKHMIIEKVNSLAATSKQSAENDIRNVTQSSEK